MIPRQLKHSPAIGPGCLGSSLNIPQDDIIVQPHNAQAQLPLCGAQPFATCPSDLEATAGEPQKRTQYPYVTGSSVLAFTYDGGLIMACDTLGAYGSTKRYKDIERIYKVNDNCVVGASGEISDFQHIQKILDDIVLDDFIAGDGITWSPRQVHAFLRLQMYHRRDKFDPLWNTLIVGGIEPDGSPFCGMVTMIGVHFDDPCVCTGFASHLALPMFRQYHSTSMTEADAKELMKQALRVCYYRDKDSINRFIISTVTKDGVKFDEPIAVATEWNYKIMQNPTKYTPCGW